jgi:uncharacterized membrane protein YfcA
LSGAFVTIPVLRLAFGFPPALTAGVSLVIAFGNSVSGAIAYLRDGRVDVKLAVIVAASGIPASIVGAIVVQHVPARGFDFLYAALLIFFFVDVVRRTNRPAGEVQHVVKLPGTHERVLEDRHGNVFRYRWNVPIALACGIGVGFVSSFFGIGGGIIFVIFFISLLGMPPHIVTATSMLAMLLTTPVGVAAHWMEGNIDWQFALPLAAGGLVGGQLGPRIARRISSKRLTLTIAYSVLLAALLLIIKHVFPF